MTRLVVRWFCWGLLSGVSGTISGCGNVSLVPLPGHLLPVCASSADCDDGLFCNGVEFCDVRTGACVSGGDPCRLPYLISRRAYNSWTDDITAEIQADYGPGATLAEWNDINAEYGGSVSSIQQFMDEIGMLDYRDDGSGGVYWVKYNGSDFWTAERHYHATRQNGNFYGWFVYHDDIQGRQMALGSWWGTVPALVKLPNTGSESGTCNEEMDVCEPRVPPCVTAGDACDEEQVCCEDLLCRAGVCAQLASCTEDADCEDDDLCTIGRCIVGECTSEILVCDDGDACTVDDCEGGDCVHAALSCNDDDPCTHDDCVGGECVFTTMECDDGDSCTIDECVAGECVFTSVPCGNPPSALAQVVGTGVNDAILIALSATDPEGDSLSYKVVDAPTHGTLTGDPPSVTYVPNEDWVGFDLFSFQADDGRSGVTSNTADVRIWVIDEEDLSGHTVTGTIDSPSDLDAWTFEGVAGQRVPITLSRMDGRTDPERNPTFALYPPGGEGAEATATGRMDRQLLSTGQYTIVVQSSRPFTWTGDYSLALLILGGQLASLTDLDGGPIVSGETLRGRLSYPADMDAFVFEGVQGQRVLITLSRMDGRTDPERNPTFALYPPGDGGAEATATGRMDRQLLSSGQYTIVVRSSRPFFWTGDYSLSLQQL